MTTTKTCEELKKDWVAEVLDCLKEKSSPVSTVVDGIMELLSLSSMIRRESERLNSMLDEALQRIQEISDTSEAESILDYLEEGRNPEALLEFVEETRQNMSRVIEEARDVMENPPECPDFDDIVSVIDRLEESTRIEWTEINYNGIRPVLTFIIEDVTLYDMETDSELELGDIEIGLVPFPPGLDDGDPLLRVLGRNLSSTHSFHGYPHPHISVERASLGWGDMCLGDVSSHVDNLLPNLELEGIIDVVESAVRTYNPESPYTYLAQWNGDMCSGCGDLRAPDSLQRTSDGEPLCDSCGVFVLHHGFMRRSDAEENMDLAECSRCQSYVDEDLTFWVGGRRVPAFSPVSTENGETREVCSGCLCNDLSWLGTALYRGLVHYSLHMGEASRDQADYISRRTMLLLSAIDDLIVERWIRGDNETFVLSDEDGEGFSLTLSPYDPSKWERLKNDLIMRGAIPE